MKGVSNSTSSTAGNGSEEPEAERFLDGAMEEDEHDLTARPWTCEEAEEAYTVCSCMQVPWQCPQWPPDTASVLLRMGIILK